MGATRSGSADPGGTDARERARGHGGFAQQCTGLAWASAATWGQPFAPAGSRLPWGNGATFRGPPAGRQSVATMRAARRAAKGGFKL
jgi:hypothetical protein